MAARPSPLFHSSQQLQEPLLSPQLDSRRTFTLEETSMPVPAQLSFLHEAALRCGRVLNCICYFIAFGSTIWMVMLSEFRDSVALSLVAAASGLLVALLGLLSTSLSKHIPMLLFSLLSLSSAIFTRFAVSEFISKHSRVDEGVGVKDPTIFVVLSCAFLTSLAKFVASLVGFGLWLDLYRMHQLRTPSMPTPLRAPLNNIRPPESIVSSSDVSERDHLLEIRPSTRVSDREFKPYLASMHPSGMLIQPFRTRYSTDAAEEGSWHHLSNPVLQTHQLPSQASSVTSLAPGHPCTSFPNSWSRPPSSRAAMSGPVNGFSSSTMQPERAVESASTELELEPLDLANPSSHHLPLFSPLSCCPETPQGLTAPCQSQHHTRHSEGEPPFLVPILPEDLDDTPLPQDVNIDVNAFSLRSDTHDAGAFNSLKGSSAMSTSPQP